MPRDGPVGFLAALCARHDLRVTLLLARRSATASEDFRVAQASDRIEATFRSRFRPSPRDAALRIMAPVLAVPVTVEEARTGVVTVAGLRVPTVQAWTAAVARLHAALLGARPRDSAFGAYRRQFEQFLDLGPEEARDALSLHADMSADAAWTVWVVVATLYRMSQTDPRAATFRDLMNREIPVEVLRPEVAWVLAAGHLANRALVLEVLFGATEAYDLAWVSTYTTGFAVVHPEVAGDLRVEAIPRLLEPQDLVEAVRALGPNDGLHAAKLVHLRGAQTSRRFRDAIAELRASAQEVVAKVAHLCFFNEAVSGIHHDCLRCHRSRAVCSLGATVLPVSCSACADGDPADVSLNVSEVYHLLSDAVSSDMLVIEDVFVSQETDLRRLKQRFRTYASAGAARMVLLDEVLQMEDRIRGGAFRFSPFLGAPGDYVLVEAS